MAADLGQMPEDPLPKGLEITQVQSEQDRVLWGELAARCIGAPEAVASALGQVEAGIEDCELDGCRRYLAFHDGTPVGTASLVLTPHVAGLYAVGTQPDQRGKGIGRALTLHALNHARHADCRVGVLQASSMGKPLYEKLGFRTLFDYVIYVQTP
ncbi:MAG: GNAT family N-acetyltransferase [Rhodobacteraceae bacterium]|nr:GNAT family N-acetyltransferase [Paracoccaceae bacterium]